MSFTRRSLQQRAVAELRRHAQELGLASTSKKSALMDRIYRAMRPTPQQQPQPQRPRGGTMPLPVATVLTGDLAAMVQELVERLQGAEDRLLRQSHPLPPHAADISLPSQEPVPWQPCAPDAIVPRTLGWARVGNGNFIEDS